MVQVVRNFRVLAVGVIVVAGPSLSAPGCQLSILKIIKNTFIHQTNLVNNKFSPYVACRKMQIFLVNAITRS